MGDKVFGIYILVFLMYFIEEVVCGEWLFSWFLGYEEVLDDEFFYIGWCLKCEELEFIIFMFGFFFRF